MTTSPAEETRNHRFLVGLIAGAVLGAGLGMLLAPQAAVELRKRLAGSAKGLVDSASEQVQEASARVGAVAQEYKSKGQAIRDSIADTVVRGAQGIERYATDAKTDHNHKASDHSAA